MIARIDLLRQLQYARPGSSTASTIIFLAHRTGTGAGIALSMPISSAHPIEDAMEHIMRTQALLNWRLLSTTPALPAKPRQIEFARLASTKLRALVEGVIKAAGTITLECPPSPGLCRAVATPRLHSQFQRNESRVNSTVEYGFRARLREDLNLTAKRASWAF